VVKATFYRNLTSLDNLIFSSNMLAWAGDGEPPYFKDTCKFSCMSSSYYPWLLTGVACNVVAVLKADFTKVPKNEFQVITTSQGEHYRISYDIQMTLEAMISFKLVYKGKIIRV